MMNLCAVCFTEYTQTQLYCIHVCNFIHVRIRVKSVQLHRTGLQVNKSSDPVTGAYFIRKFISLAQAAPGLVQQNTLQNRGLKHNSFHVRGKCGRHVNSLKVLWVAIRPPQCQISLNHCACAINSLMTNNQSATRIDLFGI